jgi:tol-pal system protein YbgF
MKSLVLISCCLFAFFGCITQDEFIALDNRLTQIELRDAEARKNTAKLESQVKTSSSGEKTLRQQSASLRAAIDQLNDDLRKLNGQFEEIEFTSKKQRADVEALVAEVGSQLAVLTELSNRNNERLARVERYLNLEKAEQPGSKIKAAGPVKKELTEDEIYNRAKQAFDQGNSEAARKGFEDLIKRFPKSDNADNAQFWIGEIYYREKWYEKAILEYQKVIENYPKGNKLPASLLKQGFAFLKLGDKANSRLILQELVRKYPKTNEAKIAAEKIKELK